VRFSATWKHHHPGLKHKLWGPDESRVFVARHCPDLLDVYEVLNPRAYSALRLAHRIKILEISVDAASTETYQSIRRGGNFDRLLKHLGFVRQLREAGEVPNLQMDFVVQDENFREMEDFVALCRAHKADRIFFSKLRNWHTYTDAEFMSRNVCSALHQHFGELLEVLDKPVFCGFDVDLGDLPRPS
jgi:MoaA/NifB/PqqE/SkfB family radical SAM enzyme